MRHAAALLLLLAASSVPLPAIEPPSDSALLAAARAVDQAYQLHLAALHDQLGATDATQRVAAIRALGRLRDPQTLPLLLTALDGANDHPDEQAEIATALGLSGEAAAIPTLRRLTLANDAGIRFAAYDALGDLGVATGADHTQRAKDADPQPHLAALANLGTVKQADAGPLLAAGLAHHPSPVVRRQCAIGLGRLGDPANGPVLQNALADPDAGVRRYAAQGIAQLDYRPAIPFLLMTLDADLASDELAQVVKRMTGQDFGFTNTNDVLKRKEAVERGFAWLAKNPQQ